MFVYLTETRGYWWHVRYSFLSLYLYGSFFSNNGPNSFSHVFLRCHYWTQTDALRSFSATPSIRWLVLQKLISGNLRIHSNPRRSSY